MTVLYSGEKKGRRVNAMPDKFPVDGIVMETLACEPNIDPVAYPKPEEPAAMPYYVTERGQPWTPLPLSETVRERGVYTWPDPELPGYLVLELWTSWGERILRSQIKASLWERRKAQTHLMLDEEDPMERVLRAI